MRCARTELRSAAAALLALAAAGCSTHPVAYDAPTSRTAPDGSVYGVAAAPPLPARGTADIRLTDSDRLNGEVTTLGLYCSYGKYPNDLRIPVTRYLAALDADGDLSTGGTSVKVAHVLSTLRCFSSGEMASRCTGTVEIAADVTTAESPVPRRLSARVERAAQKGNCASYTRALARLGEHAAADIASQAAAAAK